jgi:hypothetical protein
VCYKLNRDPHTEQVKKSDPLEVFWMDFACHPETEVDEKKLKSPLNFIEKYLAYGFHCSPLETEDQYLLNPRARPEICIKLMSSPEEPEVYRCKTVIGDREAYLCRIYVQAKENLIGIPSVQWVNIHGLDVETGEEIFEKILP